ncbi:RloB family protein [Campylobacter troglodytis]|uniref:RloB family protein n=1 Tax=Campylobacter troglodytis TaxID=654363 RepID=UPI0011595067|nr:RloB family protein [Campylobacter troglodytis]TQR61525.1 RloB [Campylobacter troglodytis]
MRKNKTHIKRFQRNLTPKKVILIVCEGEKTEKNYFNRLKNFLKLTSVSIEILPSSHPTPMQVINYVGQKAKKVSEYDEIYCVIDRDTHKDFDKALSKVQSIKLKNTILKAIVSDPCFEFWILCHFTATTQHFGGNSPCLQVQKHKDFKKNLPHYSKDYDFRDIITSHLLTAIKNSKAVNKANLSTKQSTYTQVVELVERLQGLAKECWSFIN